MNRRRFIASAISVGTASISRAGAVDIPAAITGDSFRYGENEIRLADILAPAPGARNVRPEPYSNEAKAALDASLAAGAIVINDVMKSDRWGRRVASVSVDGGASPNVEESLIAAGAARVNPESGDETRIRRLLTLESEARAARRGLWTNWRYRIFDADDASATVGAFNLIEGVVVSAAARGARAYLNFGEDFRTDFTGSAAAALARRWAKDGFDLPALTGARLRVRGFVAWINGPSIDITHKEQVEILE